MPQTFFAQLLLLLAFSTLAVSFPKHYHETGGFATNMEAGLGGKVIKVTNTKEIGPGSLKDALNQDGKRLIVFEVGGVFSGIDGISKNDVTVAGQTAPFPGVTIIRGTFIIRASNVVISHVAVRVGDINSEADGIEVRGSNVVLDHVISTWGVDETLTLKGAKNVTLYKSIISEALSGSKHAEGEHSKGNLIFRLCENISIIGCLYSHNRMRNPRISDSHVTMVNSVVYAPQSGKDDSEVLWNYFVHIGDNGEQSVVPEINFIGNVGIQGPLTDPKAKYLISGHKSEKGKVYMKDNIMLDTAGKDLFIYDSNIIPLAQRTRWPEDMKDPLPAMESFYEVLRTAGPQPGAREAVTARIIKQVADGTGKVINSQNDVGGYPGYAQTHRPVSVPDGITARRAWLDSLEDAIAVDTNIDLSRYYGRVGSKENDQLSILGVSVRNTKHMSMNNAMKMFIINKQLHTTLTIHAINTVTVSIMDLMGNVVINRYGKYVKAGSHEIVTDIRHLPAGLYICRVRIGNMIQNHNFYYY